MGFLFSLLLILWGVFFVKCGDGSGDERDAFLSETSRRILNDAMRPGVANKWELCFFLKGAAISLSVLWGAVFRVTVLGAFGLHAARTVLQLSVFVVGFDGGFDGGEAKMLATPNTV